MATQTENREANKVPVDKKVEVSQTSKDIKPEELKGIAPKILYVQRRIEVAKNGYNEKNKNEYMKDEDVVSEVARYLNELGIITTIRDRKGTHQAQFDVGGRYKPTAFIEATFVFVDVETGEEWGIEVPGEGASTGGSADATRIAQTTMSKIAYLETFKIRDENASRYDSDEAHTDIPDSEPAPIQKSEEEKVKAGNLKEVVTAINAIVNDKENPIDGARVNLEGQAIAGEDVTQPQWRKDLFVMTKLLEKLNKIMMDGEVS